jgi:hypothetical protein
MGNGFDKSHPYYSPVAAENLRAIVKPETADHELQIRQTEALASLAQGINDIASFFTQGGIQAALSAHTKGAILQGIFNGLASHGGRNSLDARTIKQNALEAVELVMAAFDKMSERIHDKNRDPEIKEPPE